MDEKKLHLYKLANLPNIDVATYLEKIREFTAMKVAHLQHIEIGKKADVGYKTQQNWTIAELRYAELFVNGQHNGAFFVSRRSVRE